MSEASRRDVDPDVYWATLPTDEIGEVLRGKIDEYYHHLETTGRIRIWRQTASQYYGMDERGTWSRSVAVEYGGDNDEIVLIRAPHIRSFISHTLVLITGTRPAFQARAMNADHEAQLEADLAEGLMDWYLDEHHLEEKARKVAHFALTAGEGWLHLEWDPMRGRLHGRDVRLLGEDDAKARFEQAQAESEEELDPTAFGLELVEQPVYEGEVVCEGYAPIDVIRDIELTTDDHQWLCLRRQESRWDLIANHPDHRDAIRDTEDAPSEALSVWRAGQRTRGSQVSVYHLWHKRCPAMPQGRYVIMCGDAILYDGDLPYDRIPLLPMMPSAEEHTPFGWSRMWGLVALQEAYDAALSTACTNVDAHGVINVVTRTGTKLSANDLGGGLRHLQTDGGAGDIDILELPSSANKAAFDLLDRLKSDMAEISGINDVARGNPDSNVTSGAMAALIHSMAIQFNSDVQGSYARLLEAMGTHLIRLIQTFATTERVAEIAGKDKRTHTRVFTGADLQRVHRIAVELGNPLMRNSAGRKDLADKFLERELIGPDQYLEVMATGRMEPIFRAPKAQLLLIKRENETLSEGGAPKVLITDHHATHIQEHLVLLSDPGVREDDALAGRVLAHIQEHLTMGTQLPPEWAAATGQQPLPMAPPAPEGAPPGPGAPMPNPDPGALAAPLPGVDPNLMPPVGQGPAMGGEGGGAQMPQPPINPLTGQPAGGPMEV